MPISARTSANVSTLLAKVTMFDANVPKYLSLGAGVFNLDVLVYDGWGATTLFTIPTPVTVNGQFGAEIKKIEYKGDGGNEYKLMWSICLMP